MIAQDMPTLLRRFQDGDLDAYMAYRSDPDIAKYQNWPKSDRDTSREFLQVMRDIEPLMRPGEWTQIAIANMHDNALIGDMGWFLSGDGTEVELGITLAAAHHGKGHASRAMMMAAAYVFANTDVAKVMAYADLRNTASIALMTRIGFERLENATYEGVDEAVFRLKRD